jgi:hypothetical protein
VVGTAAATGRRELVTGPPSHVAERIVALLKAAGYLPR